MGREANHSPPSSGEVKNDWRYTSIPPYVFTVWCFAFTFKFKAKNEWTSIHSSKSVCV